MSPVFSFAAVVLLAVASAAAVPEQVHLSLSGRADAMVVDFVADTAVCAVQYVQANTSQPWTSLQSTASWFFSEIGHTHQAAMTGLTPGAHYTYRLGCRDAYTANFTFQAQTVDDSSALRVAFVADFGLENDVSMGELLRAGDRGDFEVFVLGGDMAYDLHSNNSQVGNGFMNALQPLTATKPFMAVPGNHEAHTNFTQYCHRFQGLTAAGNASGSRTNMFHSWDHKLVHFVGINTEVYKFYNETQSSPYPFTPEEQLAWLEKDLEAAHARRSEVPWIVMFGHKAWYMDFEVNKQHPLQPELNTNFTGFTALAEKYKVDLYLAGHVHLYQRFYSLLGPAKHEANARPQAIDKDCVEEDGKVYRNCKYMTTIIAGSPGDHELTTAGMCAGDQVISPGTLGTLAMCSNNYGYGVLEVSNATHLHWEWIETGAGNYTGAGHQKTHDDLWLIKDGLTA